MSCKIDLGEKKKPCGCEAGWHPLYPWDSSEAIWQSGSVYFKRLAQRKRGFYDWTRLMLNITHLVFFKNGLFLSLSFYTMLSCRQSEQMAHLQGCHGISDSSFMTEVPSVRCRCYCILHWPGNCARHNSEQSNQTALTWGHGQGERYQMKLNGA